MRTFSKLQIAALLAMAPGVAAAEPDAGAGANAGTGDGSAAAVTADPDSAGATGEAKIEVAQAAEPDVTPPALRGYVDTQYAFNVARPANGTNLFFPYSSQHNNISLNAAHLAVNGQVAYGAERSVAYTVELDAGTDAVINTSNYAPPAAGNAYKVDVQEAYGTYKQGKWGLRAGKFVTFNGIEVIESPANPTVSRGFLFGLAEPFTHTGGEFFLQATDKVDVHAGVVNGWDVIADNNRGKTFIFKVGIVPSSSSFVTISGSAGPEAASNWRETVDVTGQVKSEKIDFNFQANVGRESKASLSGETATWFGAGVQPLFHLSDELTLGARAELFVDNNGSRTGGLGALVDPTNTKGKLMLINVSASPGYMLSKNLMLRGEARIDIADQKIYVDHEGTGATKNQIVLLAQAVASF